MRIAIGVASTNEAKIAAVHSAFRRMGLKYALVPRSTPSGVGSQPRSENETIRGAINRASALMESGKLDLAVAFEGGVDTTLWGTFACEWCAIVDRTGTVGLGGGTGVLLPDLVASRIAGGEELGPVADQVFNVTKSGATSGIFGLLTHDIVTRSAVHETALFLALARFLKPSLYEVSSWSGRHLGVLLTASIRPRRAATSPSMTALPSPQLSLLHA
jgi:inosine/xanthosine triphosphatase